MRWWCFNGRDYDCILRVKCLQRPFAAIYLWSGVNTAFRLAAFFIKPFLRFAAQFRPYLGYVEKLMGLILIFFSILLVTGSISTIANWMLLVFPELFGV